MNPKFPIRIAFAEAEAIVREVANLQRLPVERVPVARAAGRVLAEDIAAPIALPSFDNSAMDGYALRAADALVPSTSLRLVGEQFAGSPNGLCVAQGECVRITTGAPLPGGADAVVMKEDTRTDGDNIVLATAVARNAHVRRAGEDVAIGDLLLSAGMRLTPVQASLAAAVGLAELPVARRPTVAVFTTGDELRPPGQPLDEGAIYDSNRTLLMTLLVAEGLEPVAWPILPDNPDRMRALLRDAGNAFDVVITCGGVSAGEKDYLPALLGELGRIHFWKVLMRPGMPLLFGQIGTAQVLALPGNPVSVLATFLTIGRQLLRGLQGDASRLHRISARLALPIVKTHERREFQRGRLDFGGDGIVRVAPHPATASHRLRGAADS
ncbi:MAG TPA: gephyrin-like molybdotransferase Glp, partial [Xanthomonadaceae bacterium]|nr:gephyrin-like molybdotransferase Glp [Xanthomonadaceae bacterium]